MADLVGDGTCRAGIELVVGDCAPLLARPYFREGDPGPIVAALAHVPELLEVALPFLSVILGPSSIPLRRKELVILRTSATAGCRFCVNAHTVAAFDAGLTQQEVKALRREVAVASVFADPAEAALLAWVDTVAAPGPVDAATRQRLRAMLADHEVMELTLLIGATLMLNRFCTALDLPTGDEVAARLGADGLA